MTVREGALVEKVEHVMETTDGQTVRVVPGVMSVTVIWELPNGMRWHRTLECDEATKLGRMLVGASSTARRKAATGVHG